MSKIYWRTVDQDGEIIDVFIPSRRDGAAAKRFFKRLIKSNGGEPRRIVTDKLRSYGIAHRELMPDAIHDTSQYANNRAELSDQPTRVLERGVRRLVFFRWGNRLGLEMSEFQNWNKHAEQMERRTAVKSVLKAENISIGK